MLSASHMAGPKRTRRQQAFTLFEVMIAVIVFTMGILGVYTMMIKSYEMVTLSRHRDNGRAVLLTYVDQFLRLQIADAGVRRGIFVPQPPTPHGLKWTDSYGNVTNGDAEMVNPYMQIMLGDSGDPADALLGSKIRARVWREVTLIDPATGASMPGQTPTMTAAGYMLQGTFTIAYEISGRTQTQSITVLRSAR